jgi:hypothetical protein
VWSNDPENYAGSRASHARQVKGDDPDPKGYPGPPGWGLGVRLTTPPRKKVLLGNLNWRPRPTQGCKADDDDDDDDDLQIGKCRVAPKFDVHRSVHRNIFL